MKIKPALENYILVLPAILIFSVFYIIPFIWVFQLSLYNWDGILPTKTFVALANFKEIIFQDPGWWQAMRNAGYITLIALTFQNALAFLLAWACDREIRLKNFYRAVFFIPPVLSEIVVGMVWRFIINDIDGANIINRMLTPGYCINYYCLYPQLERFWLGVFDFSRRAADYSQGAL
jgi:raffinose/stachyose/melibiose transport system permease protein